MEWILILMKYLDRINRVLWIFFSQFPEKTEKNHSTCGGNEDWTREINHMENSVRLHTNWQFFFN